VSDLGLLLVRRADGAPPWSFPGGKPEPGGSPESAARREVGEECGLDIAIGAVLGQRRHPRTDRVLTYLAGHPMGATTITTADPATAEARWVSHDEFELLLPDVFAPVRAWLHTHLQR
jgi:8-oxo-dGTP diphosphatase